MASAAILRGGRASRFGGRDKGALLVGGRTVLDRQLEALSRVSDDIMLVGGGPVEPGWPARAVEDRMAGRGPLGGLDAALAAARDDVLVVLASDMPCVSADFLAYLISLAGNAEAVVPRTKGGYHPLCAAYSRACHEAVARRLSEGRLAMMGLLEDVRVQVVEPGELQRFGGERLLANVNTPDELEDLEALLSHKE